MCAWPALASTALVATFLAVGDVPAQQPAQPDRCAACHQGLNVERLARPARSFPNDVHARAGFTCLDCHGRNEAHMTPDPAGGFLSRPARARVHQMCGRCHSDAAFMRGFDPALRVDQVAEYLTSGHGRRLLQQNDAEVATCVSCHPAHEIRPPSDPESTVHPLNVARTCGGCHTNVLLMQQRGRPFDQLADWSRGVHGRLMMEKGDLSAPTCNDCHGNHGAAPPGLASIRYVCGECHATNADFFRASNHVEIFEKSGLPGCETCHDNHAIMPTADSLLTLRAEQVCGRCHQSTDSVGAEFPVMLAMLDSLHFAFVRSQEALRAAENAGMEVSQALFELEEVNNALTKARSAIHSFHLGPVKAEVDQGLGLTTRALERARAALAEHRFRRIGLAASSTLIVLLIVALFAKIRDLDRRAAHSQAEPDSTEEMHV
jgi:predicted CXXCH cytochrome family protein